MVGEAYKKQFYYDDYPCVDLVGTWEGAYPYGRAIIYGETFSGDFGFITYNDICELTKM
jgi:hypothetical protein